MKKCTSKHANLLVRVPGWARNRVVPSKLYSYSDQEKPSYAITLNGKRIDMDPQAHRGYVCLENVGKGDVVSVHFDMPVRTVVADKRVVDDRGRVAVERGPLVYCAEAADNQAAPILRAVMNKRPTFTLIDDYAIANTETPGAAAFRVKAIKTDAQLLSDSPDGGITVKSFPLTLIPYYAWNHRGANQMNVWFMQRIAE